MSSVLIVDDNPTMREILRDFLQILQPGVRILEASNGSQGFSLALSYRPNIILMDVMMPTVDGVTATRALRDTPSTSKIPVIGITACHESVYDSALFRQLCNSFLQKPFDLIALRDVMSSVWGSDLEV